jgi:CheY-like chemotaxis protein
MSGPLTGQRILVVEDEMLLMMNVEATLEDLGCTAVTWAASAADALALLEDHQFDAAMLDVNLDGETSYAVADMLAARGIPFLFATGYSDHGCRTDLLSRPTLRKPYLAGDLEQTFGRLLAAPPPGKAG